MTHQTHLALAPRGAGFILRRASARLSELDARCREMTRRYRRLAEPDIAGVYVNAHQRITGYTWSTVNNSAYKKTAGGYDTAIGRILPAIW
jgi:hypothetical protein